MGISTKKYDSSLRVESYKGKNHVYADFPCLVETKQNNLEYDLKKLDCGHNDFSICEISTGYEIENIKYSLVLEVKRCNVCGKEILSTLPF